MFEWFADHIFEIFVTILTIAVIFFTAIAICAGMSNAANKIDEGVIIDKKYHAAYVTTTYYCTDNNIPIPINTTHPETYNFTNSRR